MREKIVSKLWAVVSHDGRVSAETLRDCAHNDARRCGNVYERQLACKATNGTLKLSSMCVDLGAHLQRHPSLSSASILSLALSTPARSLQNQPTSRTNLLPRLSYSVNQEFFRGVRFHHPYCNTRSLEQLSLYMMKLDRVRCFAARPHKQTWLQRLDVTDTVPPYLVRCHSAQCCW